MKPATHQPGADASFLGLFFPSPTAASLEFSSEELPRFGIDRW